MILSFLNGLVGYRDDDDEDDYIRTEEGQRNRMTNDLENGALHWN